MKKRVRAITWSNIASQIADLSVSLTVHGSLQVEWGTKAFKSMFCHDEQL